MCNCFDEIKSDIEFANSKDGVRANAWVKEFIKVTFRTWVKKTNSYSKRLTEKNYALKYCPFCGSSLRE